MSLDILISFDTTGSMYPCLTEVRRKVVDFVNTIYDSYPDERVRVGIIAHGDYCDKGRTYVTKHVGLYGSTLKADVIRFIEKVEPTGGGDSAECYEAVINQARTCFTWEADKRVMILIGDDVPHIHRNSKEALIRNGTYAYDDHFANTPYNWREEAQLLKETGVILYPVQCLARPRTDYFYKELGQIFGTPRLELSQFSNIVQLLTAVFYKQIGNEQVLEYGQYLQASGELNRNLATVLNLLLEAEHLVGGLEYSEKETSLEAVHPARFQTLNVDNPCVIKEFVESTGAKFQKGRGFYQLTKSELVQEHKEVVVRDGIGDMFSGAKAREMIGLPYGSRGTISTRNIPVGYDVFIQSTSYTRKLMPHTQFLYEVEDFGK